MKTVAEIGEDALIREIRNIVSCSTGEIVGIGDDCAVIGNVLLKTDSVICGKHFLLEEDPLRVGRKAVNRVVSDMAAMGGRVTEILVAIALPPETSVRWVQDLYRGMQDAAALQKARIVGGETSGLNTGASAVITVSARGEVAGSRAILRSSGSAGDDLIVTGCLGGSIAGHHLDFIPRAEEGMWLAQQPEVKAMMDLSDGLAQDAARLADASECSFEVFQDQLPCRKDSDSNAALHDGEDYELLCVVDGFENLRDRWKKNFPNLPLTKVGRLIEKRDSSVSYLKGFQHF